MNKDPFQVDGIGHISRYVVQSGSTTQQYPEKTQQ